MPRSLNDNSVFVPCTAFVIIDIFNILLFLFFDMALEYVILLAN